MSEPKPEALADLTKRVQDVLTQLEPALQADGGGLELVKVTLEGTVLLRFSGACSGCPMRQVTFEGYISRRLRSVIPEVTEVALVP